MEGMVLPRSQGDWKNKNFLTPRTAFPTLNYFEVENQSQNVSLVGCSLKTWVCPGWSFQ